jgi:hypothetical protein
VRIVSGILRGASNARWPMYLRNVKQLLRTANFDERSYGFGGLMDLLRACQRDGLLRVERDRRRGLRVFHGTALGPVGISRSQFGHAAIPQPDTAPPVETTLVDAGELPDDGDNVGNLAAVVETGYLADVIERQPTTVVDTTAELLGRAKPKRSGTRAAAASGARRSTKKAGTSVTTRRTGRTRPKEE